MITNKIKVREGREDKKRYWENISLENIEGELWVSCRVYTFSGELLEFNSLYEISNMGRVKSLNRVDCKGQKRKERILKQDISTGYSTCFLYKDAVKYRILVHRMCLSSFLGKPKEKHQGNHINAIRTDNTLSNLEWVTSSQNIKHAFNIGTKKAHKRTDCIAENSIFSKGVNKIDIITGDILKNYPCDRLAGLDNGVSTKAINRCVTGRAKTSAGYKWERP